MEILWLVIGIVIGLLVAWFFLNARCSKQLSEQRARLSETNRRVEQALEQERKTHDATKQRLSELEAKEASTAKQIAALTADLDAGRAELESAKADAAENSAGLAQLKSQSDDLQARLDAAEDARAQLDAQLRETQADRDAARDDCQSQITTLESRLRDRDEEIARLESELAALQAKSESPSITLSSEVGTEPAPHSLAEVVMTGPTDDLTKIKGIGPVLKEKLHALGITSFQQIADFAQADIDRVNEVLDFPGRIEREQWVEQAKAIVSHGTDEGNG